MSPKGHTSEVHIHQVLQVLIITVRTSDADVNLSAFKFISVASKNILFIVTPGREGEDERSSLSYLDNYLWGNIIPATYFCTVLAARLSSHSSN